MIRVRRKLMRGLKAALLLTFLISGTAIANAQTAEVGRVQINSQKRFAKSRLTVRFIELVEDSRCPVDTNCVWAGNAEIKIRVTRNGRSRILELNTGIEPRQASFAGYSFRITDLTPVPRSNIRINRNGYVAMIAVRRL